MRWGAGAVAGSGGQAHLGGAVGQAPITGQLCEENAGAACWLCGVQGGPSGAEDQSRAGSDGEKAGSRGTGEGPRERRERLRSCRVWGAGTGRGWSRWAWNGGPDGVRHCRPRLPGRRTGLRGWACVGGVFSPESSSWAGSVGASAAHRPLLRPASRASWSRRPRLGGAGTVARDSEGSLGQWGGRQESWEAPLRCGGRGRGRFPMPST